MLPDLPSFSVATSYMFYYDQFMNKTHVEGMKNICQYIYCYPFKDHYHKTRVNKQGKSEGFDSCDWPCNLAYSNWIKIVDFSARVTLKFDEWPQKTIGHLFYTTSSFVHHFKSISWFKLELQSGNAQFGTKSAIFCPVWPWNLIDDLVKQ